MLGHPTHSKTDTSTPHLSPGRRPRASTLRTWVLLQLNDMEALKGPQWEGLIHRLGHAGQSRQLSGERGQSQWERPRAAPQILGQGHAACPKEPHTSIPQPSCYWPWLTGLLVTVCHEQSPARHFQSQGRAHPSATHLKTDDVPGTKPVSLEPHVDTTLTPAPPWLLRELGQQTADSRMHTDAAGCCQPGCRQPPATTVEQWTHA